MMLQRPCQHAYTVERFYGVLRALSTSPAKIILLATLKGRSTLDSLQVFKFYENRSANTMDVYIHVLTWSSLLMVVGRLASDLDKVIHFT